MILPSTNYADVTPKAAGKKQPPHKSKAGKGKCKIAIVDFETYYDKDVTLKKQGTYHYLRHELSEIYMVCIVGDNGLEYVGEPENAPWDKIDGAEWGSWNTFFDEQCYERLGELDKKRYKARPSIWFDVSQLSVYLGGARNLAQAIPYFFPTETHLKDMRSFAKGKHAADLKAAGKWEDMRTYCVGDGRYPLRIWMENRHKWPAHEQRLGRLTIDKCLQGVLINQTLVKQNITKLEKMMWTAAKKLPWVKDPDEDTILSLKALAIECRKAGIEPPASTAEDSPETEIWEKKYSKKFPWVGHMRTWRKANILLKKLNILRDRVMPNGRVRYGLKYFGGHTGRWSGDAGFNIQNPNKEPWEGVDLRACIVAPPGGALVIADLAQIEPRVLYWFCELWDTLEEIAKGVSIYEVHARKTMGWKGGNIKKENPKQQFLAKQRVLALGYGCGWEKFKNRCAELGFILTEKEARDIVKDFRAKSKAITDLWRSMDTAFKRSYADKKRIYQYELPSGRVMSYRNVLAVVNKIRNEATGQLVSRVEYTARTEAYGPQRKLYGGLLVENLVQATSREVFAECLLRLHDLGFNWTFHVHDEVVIEVPKSQIKQLPKIKAAVGEALKVTPSWLEGCPVDSEVSDSPYYIK